MLRFLRHDSGVKQEHREGGARIPLLTLEPLLPSPPTAFSGGEHPASDSLPAETKTRDAGGLHSWHLFLEALRAEKAKAEVPADSVSGDSLARQRSPGSFTRALIPFTGASPSGPSPPPKAAPPNANTLGLFQGMKRGHGVYGSKGRRGVCLHKEAMLSYFLPFHLQ